MSRDLSVNLCGVTLKNPVIAASGTFGYGKEYSVYISLRELGGISLKALTATPREGNPPPRITETPSGNLNSVGLQNPGIDAFLANEMPRLEKSGATLIANVAGSSIEEYCTVVTKLRDAKIDLIELNISCPNVKEGGVAFGARPEAVREVVREAKACAKQPMIVKLSPNVVDIREVALAAEEAGADALSMINTLTGMVIDVHTRRPVLGNITGGLSGPAVRPVAVRMVYQAAQVVKIPIVGIGGILTGEDAVQFLLAGATAVMVGTGNLMSPTTCREVIRGIDSYMERYGVEKVTDLIGALRI